MKLSSHVSGDGHVFYLAIDDPRHIVVAWVGKDHESEATEIVRRFNAHEELVETLEMQIARVEGHWDHPLLVKYGPLRTDPATDMAIMARAMLAKLKE